MKRTLAFGALWTASAAAAVGLGLLAVSFVDAGATPGTAPAAATATSTPSVPSPSGGGPSAPTPVPVPTSLAGEQVTSGGTVYASCEGGVLSLASAPAAGFWVDDSSDPGEVEFENDEEKYEVEVRCEAGGPVFRVDGRSEGSGVGTQSPSTPTGSSTAASSSSASSPSSVDDSDGRSGGGHGSDD